ncbi:zinc finger CCCH domain-containing protein 13 isoform X2 [Dunckerocampus dactyliophorus]|uniref:zinc finger CCCH domain-containing protein 13 isoform X2 n=1 Tax=Dunckerocampus dactyliophorus TaxID=161453 RepID=UPI00240769FD|nr:zinc finger CCCH domain-containing protein 13 isoform X2 [Dunckerocampus dactyliophorus]
MSKIRRKVTVENSKTISDSSSTTASSSTSNPAAPSRRPSVFERLGPSTGSNAADSHCRNWLKTGNCSYGNTCRYTHGSQPRGKGFNFSRSAERPTGDLRERMKNKRQDNDPESVKRDLDEPASPTGRQRDSSRGRHREKEGIKITKERTPASEEEPPEWETTHSDIGDYDYELSLEMKRQKIQRELMKLEQENLDKREEMVVKKDETSTKTRSTAVQKASPEQLSSRDSPSTRKSSGSPKHKSGVKGSGKKEKKALASSPIAETAKSKGSHSKKKGPRTPSPPPPVPLDIPVVGKKHKGKHKNKEKGEEKQKEGKDRGRDAEKHKGQNKKEKHRDRSDSSHKTKRLMTSEERSGSVSPPTRKKSISPKAASHKATLLVSPPRRSPSPQRHQRTPTPPHRRSPSSRSDSSPQRHSTSPRRRRSSSPAYHRSGAAVASSPPRSQRSRSPAVSHDASSPHRRSDRSSPARRHSRGRERSRGDRERSPHTQERRRERRDDSRSKREKDNNRDDRDYDTEQVLSRDSRDDRDSREARERRDGRARDTARELRDRRDVKETRESRTETRCSRESLERRDREREREKDRDREREREKERERMDTLRKEEAAQDDRSYGRSHGREEGGRDVRAETRTERNGRGRGREIPDKGSNRNSRGSQMDSSHENWESRSGGARERSIERSNASERDRYDGDKRGEQGRDSSYDRRGGHSERDRRDNRDRDQRAASPNRHQRRSEESERDDRRDERRADRGDERREDRTRDRERDREREREREKDREREREKEREKEREAERERARERERDREREREREEREREREERERERKEREREREQRERERQREWEERERGRDERRERREDARDDRAIRETRDDRKTSRKRHRLESSPSPRPSPKRGTRDVSPADSDGYISADEKSERPIGRGLAKLHPQPLLPSPVCPPPSDSADKHRLLSQVVRPQEPPLRSPLRATAPDDKPGHWKDEERRGAADKRELRSRHEDQEVRGERSRGGDRRGDQLPDTHSDARSRGRDLRNPTPPPVSVAPGADSEDRDVAGSQPQEDSKKKTKSLRKGLKKGRKDESEVAGGKSLTEPPTGAMTGGPPSLHSPRKGAKKKVLERKRKRSHGDSDVSEEDSSAHQPHNKRKRGPRTPPPSLRPGHRGTGANAEPSPQSKTDNFSDWSDEEVSDRGQLDSAVAEQAPTEPPRRGCGPRMGRERERRNPLPIAPLLLQDPPMMLQTLTPQPLMSQPLLRKPLPEQTRSSSMGSNQSRTSSRRPRSPSSESAHRDDLQGPRSRRGRLQGSGAHDRERERERERLALSDPPGAERKSRIDQLRRAEPSRSTSSDRQDSRSHSSRRSSPDSERQARSQSRAGSYDSRERERDREQFDRERDRKDVRQQQPGLILQQPLQQQRDWDPESREWPSRGREPLLMRPSREPLLRERDIRDRERLLPEGLIQQHERERERERDRERERLMMLASPSHSDTRAAARGDLIRQDRGDYEPLLPREAFSPPEPEKPSNSHHVAGEQPEMERIDSIDGEDDGKEDDSQSVASVGEEYEPISDDELDEILADSQKKEEQQDEEKIAGPLDVIDVDWSSLMPRQKQEPRAAGAALLRFTPGAVLLRAGVSKRLAGPQLLEKVKEVCKAELDDPKDADKLFEHDLGALNMAALNRRVERAGLLSNLGPCCKALCARRDLAIRRELLKNDKGLTKQYPMNPVVDSELLQMSMRLFRKTVAGPERSDGGSDPAPELSLPAPPIAAQPEVCVS